MTSTRHPHHEGSGVLGHALRMLLLGVLVQRSWARLAQVHRHRMTARPARAPERVQRWEGEGGNVMPAESAGTEATADASV